MWERSRKLRKKEREKERNNSSLFKAKHCYFLSFFPSFFLSFSLSFFLSLFFLSFSLLSFFPLRYEVSVTVIITEIFSSFNTTQASFFSCVSFFLISLHLLTSLLSHFSLSFLSFPSFSLFHFLSFLLSLSLSFSTSSESLVSNYTHVLLAKK